MKRFILVLLSVLLLLVSCAKPAEPDRMDFTVYDHSNNKVTYIEMIDKNKPLVINFWTTWCTYCIQEMPDFNEVYKEYGDKVNFMMIDVNGGGNDDIDEAKAYVEKEGYGFPVYFDTDLSAATAYGISSFPTTVIIDSNGITQYAQPGMMHKETLISILDDILK